MLLYYRFQVLDDGNLIDNDTGAIIRYKKKKDGTLFHTVPKGNHSNGYQYFSVEYLLNKMNVDMVEEINEGDLPDDYQPVEIIKTNGRKISDVVFDDILGDL